jgi:hypothetical protein
MSRIDVGLDIIKHQHSFKSVHWSNRVNFQDFWGNKKWLKVNKNLQACITIQCWKVKGLELEKNVLL